MNVQDNIDWTPLHYAAYHGNLSAVSDLINAGGNVNSVDVSGKTPLHIAFSEGRIPVVHRLLESGAQFNIKDNGSKYPTQYLSVDESSAIAPNPTPDITANKDLCESIKTLFNNPIHSDLKFHIKSSENESTIYAHKCIIQSRCPKLLDNIVDGVVSITDTNIDLFQAVIEYIYSGAITFENGEIELGFAFDLAKKAGELLFPSLSQFSENMIISNLDEQTVVSVLEFAETYGCCKQVETYCRYFIVKYFDKLINFEEGKNLSSQKLINVVSNLPLATQTSESGPLDEIPARFNIAKGKVFTATGKKDINFENPTGSDMMQGILLESVTNLHNELMDEPEAAIFNFPVDYEAYGYLDYPYIIKNPMDFGTIESKIIGKQYRTLKNYSSDVRLVFDNARVYNKPDSSVHAMAITLLNKFEEKYNRLKVNMGLTLDYDKLKPRNDSYYEKAYKRGFEAYMNRNPPTTFTAPPVALETPKSPPPTQSSPQQPSKPPKRKTPTQQRVTNGTPSTQPTTNKTLTQQDIEELGQGLNELDDEQVQRVIELLNVQPNEDGECEIDITNLDPDTFYKLKQFIEEETSRSKRLKTDDSM